jgi:hypothetical protein
MTALVNVAGILLFAFLVFAAVTVGLRFLIPSEPYRAERGGRPRTARRMLSGLINTLAVVALMLLAIEVRFAYGAPFGDRGAPVVEVVEVGECERAALGFGVARSCELAAFRYAAFEQDPAPWDGPIEVVTGEPVRPGDQVACYSSYGWTAFAFLGSGGSHWQPVAAEGRPNLVWLPTATLVVATALSAGLQRRFTTRAALARDA